MLRNSPGRTFRMPHRNPICDGFIRIGAIQFKKVKLPHWWQSLTSRLRKKVGWFSPTPPPPRLVFLCSSHDFIQCISCHDPSIWGGGCFQMLIKWLPVVSWVCSLTFHTLWELLCPFNILSFWWCLFRPSKLTCLKEAIPAGVLAMVVCQGDPSILFTSLETEDYKLELFNHE